MNYELGSLDNFEIMQPNSQNKSATKSFSNKANNSGSDSFLTADILPSKEEDLKHWSSEMDSNILF